MATETTVFLVDDLDGTRDDVQTIGFGLDGKDYEIDLSDKNRESLLDVLAPFMAAARKGARTGDVARRRTSTGGRVHLGAAAAAGKAPTEAQLAKEWLVENGYVKAGTRGRLSADNLDIYRRRDSLDGGVKEERPAAKPSKELANSELSTEYVAAVQEVTDEVVMVWWQSKGYKPPKGGVVNGLMRAQYKAAHGLAQPHAS